MTNDLREDIYRKQMMNDIQDLIDKETDFAEKNRTAFRHGNDAVGVMEEELWEADSERQGFLNAYNTWKEENVYSDCHLMTKEKALAMRKFCESWAMEVIQLGAMAQKIVNTCERWI